MKKLLCLAILTLLSMSVFPNGDDWYRRQNQLGPAEEKPQQRMEAPASSLVGGSESGELNDDKNQAEEKRREEEKQKFLYEYEEKYRRGF